MKSFLLLCLLVGLAAGVSAQHITGRAIMANGKPAAYATATLHYASNALAVKAILAGTQGEFTFAGMPKGQYFVVVDAIGTLKTISAVFEYDGEFHALDPVVMDDQPLMPGFVPRPARRPVSDIPAGGAARQSTGVRDFSTSDLTRYIALEKHPVSLR